MAIYKAITNLFLPGNLYALAGDLINDTGVGAGWLVPSSYVPPAQAVDPQDSDALTKYFAAGPHLDPTEIGRALYPWGQDNGRWVGGNPGFTPSTYWYGIAPGLYALKGHEGLGSKLPS